jgi:hypothetical protein
MNIPALHSQLAIGDSFVYVVEIEEPNSRTYGTSGMDATDGRYVITAHDDDGNEVEIRFFPSEDDD